ncbi:hypothetical protein WA026_016296 [Henosepilachna vigintioctopunctata]|uniref:Uncharacterized protein n=1 Tax=Henosepilachna vigintioctopunctata TaxID=420089 RepID=A0AAW1UKS5_9CUCU
MEANESDIQQDLCRLCNSEADENSEMFSVFDKNEEGQEIINLIQDCLHLIVCRTDPLSKSVCAECLENLNNLYKFKKKTLEVANKHKEKLRTNGDNDESVQVFLSYEKVNNGESESSEQGGEKPEDEIKKDAATSTEDINILCNNCQAEILGAHKVSSELELCAELHQAIADSFSRNKIVTSDKTLRSKRKRSQAFYHELDDSLCSSLTEFTNTESSQCFEFQSESDSVEDDDDSRSPKRRKLDNSKEPVVQTPEVSFETKFEEEDEYRYNPLSLLQLCLNVINKENIPEHEPDDFYEELVEPKCSYCGKTYRNSKLLALHEVTHMSIELGEKVDNPIPWHESRDDAHIRNKWLTSEDDIVEEESYMENETMESEAIEIEPEEEEESLLIPVGSAEQRDGQNYEVTREVNLIDGKPYVDGLPLSDYPKEERRAFYHSMRIGKVNKRFCALCRYSFKDNWAIESHYFSMACYYTCRYCGMRFNKQRNRFEEHLEVHIKNNHEYSKKVFAASKNNNIVPKVLLPKKRYSAKDKDLDVMLPQPIEVRDYTPISKKLMKREFKCKQESLDYCPSTALLVRDYTPISKKNMKPEFQVKQEPLDYCPSTVLFEQTQQMQQPQLQTSQMKTGNQAYFCRKCYKVFFKLDEFNVHSRNCDFNQFSGTKAQNVEPTQTTNSGRPVRNCAKEAGPYRDELYIPEHLLKDQVHTSSSQGPYICYICNTPFPTIYSRNSHMRIHKAENIRDTPPSTIQNQPNKYRSAYQDSNQFQKTSVAHLAQVKQEPLDLEPEVEIHEQTTQDNYSANISPSVSITPIRKNPNQKTQINANVMKLVQNNPQLSIKNRETQQQNHQQMQQQQLQYQQMMGGPPDDKTYKCSSCWEAFANKSHLYFHKKNQCEGSKYPCPFCKKRFGTEAAYSSHIFYSHPE